ncbi:hypothetical protein QBC46DRAFT_348615, partial [Diplogelasinospora grovesii]
KQRVHGEVHFRKFGEELASEYRVGQIPSELGKEREREQDALRDVMDVDTSSDYDGNSSDGDGPEDKIILGKCATAPIRRGQPHNLPTPSPSANKEQEEEERPIKIRKITASAQPSRQPPAAEPRRSVRLAARLTKSEQLASIAAGNTSGSATRPEPRRSRLAARSPNPEQLTSVLPATLLARLLAHNRDDRLFWLLAQPNRDE